MKDVKGNLKKRKKIKDKCTAIKQRRDFCLLVLIRQNYKLTWCLPGVVTAISKWGNKSAWSIKNTMFPPNSEAAVTPHPLRVRDWFQISLKLSDRSQVGKQQLHPADSSSAKHATVSKKHKTHMELSDTYPAPDLKKCTHRAQHEGAFRSFNLFVVWQSRKTFMFPQGCNNHNESKP